MSRESGRHGLTLAESIRRFAQERIVAPCRGAGVREFAVRAGDVHADMGLTARLPAVCAALGSRKFQEQNDLELLRTEGPHNGANTTFHFRVGRASKPPHPSVATSGGSLIVARSDPGPRTARDAADRIFLVSCVAGKQETAAPARDLYTSSWFRKARELVEATGSPWFILSAECGLVHPGEVIAPYERTLNRMGMRERREWARRVRDQMDELLPDAEEIVLLAGELRIPVYRDRAFRLIVTAVSDAS